MTSSAPTDGVPTDGAPTDSPPPDPMKGFRGVMAGTLVLEAIVVGLGLLVVQNLYGGLGTALGILVGVVSLALLVTCGLLRHPWSIALVAVLQLVLVGCVVAAVPIGMIGLLFAVVWGVLLWMRRDVARRMAAGNLPSQQSNVQS